MKLSKTFLTGILGAVLVLEMALGGCDNGTTDNDGGGNVPVVTLTPDNGQILVNWTAASGVAYYQVVWGVNLQTPPAALTVANSVDNIAVTNYTINPAVNGNSYSVWVRGKKADSAYTDYSERKTATPQASDAPPAKPEITVTPTDEGEIKVTWPAARGATSYQVTVGVQDDRSQGRVMANNVITPTEVTTGAGAIASVTNAGAGPQYYVWVTAANVTSAGTAQSTHSDSKTVTVVEPPVNEAAFGGATWKTAAGATIAFNADKTLVYTPTGAGAAAQDGAYTYNKPYLELTVGAAAAVQILVRGKTFTYSNAKFIRQ